jgi:hypothetical protein
MRFGLIKRFLRFMFLPITLFALLVAFDFSDDQRDIYDY